MSTVLYITAPHFTAGAVCKDGVVVKVKEQVSYMEGWTISFAQNFCKQMNWGCQSIDTEKTSAQRVVRI